ncbi:hypothetical protein D3C84_288040 [compost metagenome]
MLAVALEDRVLAHIDYHIQVARRTAHRARLAFAGQANAITGIDTGRNLHRQGLVLFHPAMAMAGAARIGDHLAAAMAARTGLLHREEALLHAHLTDTATGGTGHRRGAFLRPGAFADLAIDQGRHPDVDRSTAHGLFQIQLQGVAQIAAALGAATLTATPAGATEEVAEHIAEDIGEIRPAKAGATRAAHARIHPGMPVLIVGRTLAGIGQYFVGLVGILEQIFRRFIVGIAVRVMLHRQAPVGLFQLRFAGAALDTEHLVIITFSHKSLTPLNRILQTRQRGSKLPRDGS